MSKPDPDETGHTLRRIEEGTVQERLQEKKKVELEKKYDTLATESEKDWRTDKAKATGTFVGQVLGVIAGAVAGALIGAALGGVGGAILGAVIGAVAGAIIGGL